MAVKYLLIRPNGSTKLGKTSWPLRPAELEYKVLAKTVKELLELSNGRHFERVRVWFNDQYLDMFVDDYGQGTLPVNYGATAIYQANIRVHSPRTLSDSPDALAKIYGPALIFFERVWF